MTYSPFPRDALLLSLLYIDRLGHQTHSPLFPSSLRPSRHSSSPNFKSLPQVDVSEKSRRPLINQYTIHRLLMTTLLVASKVSCISTRRVDSM